MTSTKRPLTIGIAGGTGAGKTTLSAAIRERVGQHIAYIPHDSYYKNLDEMPITDQEVINFDHPDALDTSLLIEHIIQLQQWQTVEIPIYDFPTHSRSTQTRCIEPQSIILVEGILLFTDPALRNLFDIRIFVDTDADIRFIRRLQCDVNQRGRSVESVMHQYLASVRLMHFEYVEPTKHYADIIIPEGGKNLAAIDMILDRIHSLLHSEKVD